MAWDSFSSGMCCQQKPKNEGTKLESAIPTTNNARLRNVGPGFSSAFGLPTPARLGEPYGLGQLFQRDALSTETKK
jgi:hypothetical protein